MTLRERLLKGERVKVQGKYTAKRFQMQRVEASWGVWFLQAFDLDGKRIAHESVLWNHPSADAWIQGVRLDLTVRP